LAVAKRLEPSRLRLASREVVVAERFAAFAGYSPIHSPLFAHLFAQASRAHLHPPEHSRTSATSHDRKVDIVVIGTGRTEATQEEILRIDAGSVSR
jgi:hypothetical protein